ncbi:MAG TPA: hypothetical protein VI685_29120 [Candidatus Angelobacter sp.]
MRISKLGPLMLFCSLLAAPYRPQQKPADDSKEMKEINKTFDDIKKAHDNGAADDSDEIKKLKTQAIEQVDKGYKIPNDNAAPGYPKYDPGKVPKGAGGKKNEASSAKDGKKVKTSLGEDAFSSPGWLASTKLHEIVGHGGQAANGRWYNDAKGSAINEVECYDLEIANAEKNGLSKDEIEILKKRRKEHYDKLDDDNKKKVDNKDYTVAMLEPPDKSVGELAGNAQVFVAGTVTADEVTQVTVRGPREFQGVVVEVEANGKRVKARTDSHGHAMINLAVLGTIGGATIATVRALGQGGKPLTTGQTHLEPRPAIPQVGRPELPKVPAQLRNGDIVTLKGSNLGADTRLVAGNQVQENLAASNSDITAFVSAPVGPQPVYAVTPFGVSQSQISQFYSFNLAATQNTIARGQHLTASAQYAGLPAGTQITFTNATPEVVKVQAQGGTCSGQQCVVRVSESSGTASLDLLGQSAGKFVIQYQINFPH